MKRHKKAEAPPEEADLADLRAAMRDWKDEEVAEEVGLALDDLQALRREVLLREQKHLVGRSTAEIYADYVLHTQGSMRALGRVIDSPDLVEANPSAYVTAVKARQAFLDHTIEIGQKLGVVDQAADRHLHVVAHLTDAQLAAHIAERMREMSDMMRGHGDVPFSDVEVLDTTPRPPHLLPVARSPSLVVERTAVPAPRALPLRRRNTIRELGDKS